jgi:hypothetical protein
VGLSGITAMRTPTHFRHAFADRLAIPEIAEHCARQPREFCAHAG